ncbi:hypothetical protein [Chryseobacterium taiwanense]|uniref:Uncharacterized protein n=1 Tax=Chryseobacterium taiwanense TaxID=363331 RepID=A0A0B4D929_9FLAO|nr:hypothetical protein [Chryseobacterium taiwanense]KIC63201.1 hypothetical protein RM51_09120 [Chryseobacterium taiwanense]
MDLFDYSFFKLIFLLVLVMSVMICLYLFLRKNSSRSGFWYYGYDFPHYKKYMEIKKKSIDGKGIEVEKEMHYPNGKA